MISVFYTSVLSQPDPEVYEYNLSMLPVALQKKNRSYLRWQDRMNNLMGLVMLVKGLGRFGYDHKYLDNLTYSSYGRPQLPNGIDFNISHSGSVTVCALASGIRIGVDVEKIRNISLNDMKGTMSINQWRSIEFSVDPLKKFFEFWAAKESAIKADGRGLSFHLLKEIAIEDTYAMLEGNVWSLNELAIDQAYKSYLATDRACTGMVQIQNLTCEQLLISSGNQNAFLSTETK